MDLALTITDWWLWYQPLLSFPYLYDLYICVGFLSHKKLVDSIHIGLWLTNQPQKILTFCYACLAWQICKTPNGTPLQDIKCNPALPCKCSNLWLLSHGLFWSLIAYFIVVSTTRATHVDTLSTFQQQQASYQWVLLNLVVRSSLLCLHGR